jgi:hypothetical protein
MTAPATPVAPAPASSSTPAHPTQTHPCARCGAPVALDVGLCERCNPLGLRDSASSQVHGTVFLAIGAAIAGLAIAAHLAVAGIGPFDARVTSVRAGDVAPAVVATLEIHNGGNAAGSATCRISDPRDPGLVRTLVVYSQRIEAGATVRRDQPLDFGTAGAPLNISCDSP